MINWSEPAQTLRAIAEAVILFSRTRRREEAMFALAALMLWVGVSVEGWLTSGLPAIKTILDAWHGVLIVQLVFLAAGIVLASYASIRLWRLVHVDELPPTKDRPSAIKGPSAFTNQDGALFRKLGREVDLQKLLGYVLDDQVPMVVLMGASGAGKTSLLRAGLPHILANQSVKYHYWEAVPTDSDGRLLRTLQETWQLGRADDANAPVLASLSDLVDPSAAICPQSCVIVLDQFEQLRSRSPVLRLLRKVVRESRPPHRVTWVIAFRREFRPDWSDFIIDEQERGFYPPESSLRLFTTQQAQEVIAQLVNEASLSIEQAVVNDLLEAATVEGEVSPADIGIGLLVLAELHESQGGRTVTINDYRFAGGAEGLLTQYIDRCLDRFADSEREIILKALLLLCDPEETNQRLAEGLSALQLATEVGTQVRDLEPRLQRLVQRDVRLLEMTSNPGESVAHFRLPHDRVVPALRRLTGKLLGEVELARLKFENAYLAWQKDGQSARYLLKGAELRLIERYANQIPWHRAKEKRQSFLRLSRRKRSKVRASAVAIAFASIAIISVVDSELQRVEGRRYLNDSHYPSELYTWQRHLKTLALAEPLNLARFTWLSSDSVESLFLVSTASSSSIRGMASLADRASLRNLSLFLTESQVHDLKPLEQLTGLTQLSLDLGRSEVSDLKPLEQLTGLTQLSLDLGRSEVSDLKPLEQLKGLTQLSLDVGREVGDLKPLAQLKGLTQLSLYLGRSEVSDLKPLEQLKGLTQLSLDVGREESDLKSLAQLKGLTQLSLDLGDSEVSDLTPLAQLKGLTQLSLYLSSGNIFSGSEVSDLKPLAQLTGLTQLSLNLGRSEVSDLKSLEQLEGLAQLSLNLGDSEVSDLKPLAQLKGLTQLSLNFGRTKSDLKPLAQLKGLTQLSLNLGDNEVSDLKPLEQLTGLTQLSLNLGFRDSFIIGRRPMGDLKPLEQLKGLTQLSLNLGDNEVSDLKPLEQLTGLTQLSLDLGRSEVSDLKPLEQLTGLTQLSLDLGASEVSDLKPLAQLTGLTQLSLDLDASEVSDLKPLAQLTGLTQLSLDVGREVSDLKPLAQLKGLTQLSLDLGDSEVSDLKPLAQLKGLTQLSLEIGDSEMSDLDVFAELASLQALSIYGATTDQRVSLKRVPVSMVELNF